MAGALQPVIVLRLEILVLRSSHLIDSFSDVFAHVEPVVHQLGIRSLFRHGIGVRRKHVGCHGSNLAPLLRRQGLEDRFRGDLRPVLNNVYDRLHSVLWAAASRESGYQLRCELHGVEVPPTPFIGMISKATIAAAFRTGDARA